MAGEAGRKEHEEEDAAAAAGEEPDSVLPRDAKIIKSLLRSMGVQHHEPRVVHQLLDFCYRYVVEVLSDAQTYSEHASKSAIDTDDVKLAIQSRVNFSFSQPPPRETLLELARIRNSIPLPKAINGAGIALPPEQDTLIAPNYQLAMPYRTANHAEEEMEVDNDDENEAELENDKSLLQSTSIQKSESDVARKVTFAFSGKWPKS